MEFDSKGRALWANWRVCLVVDWIDVRGGSVAGGCNDVEWRVRLFSVV